MTTGKALSKYDLEWWSNKVSFAYNDYKNRVVKSCNACLEEIKEAEGKINTTIANKIVDIIKEQSNHVPEDNKRYRIPRDDGRESKNYIDHDVYSTSAADTYDKVTFVIYRRDIDEIEVIMRGIEELRQERCTIIRCICEEKQRERDELLVRIHSRPTSDELLEIDEWVKKTNGEYKDTNTCMI